MERWKRSENLPHPSFYTSWSQSTANVVSEVACYGNLHWISSKCRTWLSSLSTPRGSPSLEIPMMTNFELRITRNNDRKDLLDTKTSRDSPLIVLRARWPLVRHISRRGERCFLQKRFVWIEIWLEVPEGTYLVTEWDASPPQTSVDRHLCC